MQLLEIKALLWLMIEMGVITKEEIQIARAEGRERFLNRT